MKQRFRFEDGVILTVLGVLSLTLTIWLFSTPVQASNTFQESPLESPTPDEFAPVDPTATETETETATPTATPEILPSETPTPSETPLAADSPTPTEQVSIISLPLPGAATATSTPAPRPILPNPELRAIVLPSLTPTPHPLLGVARSAESTLRSLAWIWLVGGVLLFFTAAGLLLGLVIYRPKGEQFTVKVEESPWGQPPGAPYTPSARNDELDHWPSSLP